MSMCCLPNQKEECDCKCHKVDIEAIMREHMKASGVSSKDNTTQKDITQ